MCMPVCQRQSSRIGVHLLEESVFVMSKLLDSFHPCNSAKNAIFSPEQASSYLCDFKGRANTEQRCTKRRVGQTHNSMVLCGADAASTWAG